MEPQINPISDSLLTMPELDHDADISEEDQEGAESGDAAYEPRDEVWLSCDNRYSPCVDNSTFLAISALAVEARKVLLAGEALPQLIQHLTDLSWEDEQGALANNDIVSLERRCSRGEVVESLTSFTVDISRIQLRAKVQR
jgi:hypothetical protein